MCKSMNALFLSFHGQRTRKQLLDKLSRSSNKKEGGYLMYSKNGIPWVRPPTRTGSIEKIISGGQNNGR